MVEPRRLAWVRIGSGRQVRTGLGDVVGIRSGVPISAPLVMVVVVVPVVVALGDPPLKPSVSMGGFSMDSMKWVTRFSG